MPRKPDARLEGRIVDAAYRLWSKGGEQSLTMRAVAKAAGTTTPTVYERFNDKKDLVEYLRSRARQELFAAMKGARSTRDICERALDYFSSNENAYRLLTADWAVRLAREERLPSFELVQEKLAEQLGGQPKDYRGVALGLVALVHGTATILLGEDVHERISAELREACLDGCDALVQGARARQA